MKIRILFALLISLIMISCKKDKPIVDSPKKTGNIHFQFSHKVNGQILITDTLVYTNTAGNHYMVNDIKYFISEITLHNSNGSNYVISSANGIHYIDTDIPSTYLWQPIDNVPAGNYTSVSFIFGINQEKNIAGLFTNPPEVNMAWPQPLGGGFHYMQLNGWWMDTNAMLSPLSFHLGIGQIYSHDVIVLDSITGFVQNYFTVNLPSSALTITANATTNAEITMNIDSWFDTPNVYNFDYWGGSIMQNQTAMRTIVENGADVFTFQLNP
ncbi:MAG: MbnP family protein [Bacteroidota bacterium]